MSEYTIVTAREAERFRELSAGVQTASRPVFLDHDFDHLIAPVRPSMKSRYPLIPMADYCRWHNTHGEPFDPWLRVHAGQGGRSCIPACAPWRSAAHASNGLHGPAWTSLATAATSSRMPWSPSPCVGRKGAMSSRAFGWYMGYGPRHVGTLLHDALRCHPEVDTVTGSQDPVWQWPPESPPVHGQWPPPPGGRVCRVSGC